MHLLADLQSTPSRFCAPCGETIPARNLHLIMGTMLAHPRTFIIIGLLRSGLDPAELARQASLF
jgi:hypothetical protein